MKSVSVFSLLVSIGLITVAVACTKTVTRVVPSTTDAGTTKDSGVTTKPSGTTDDDDATADDDDATAGDDDDTTSSSSSSSSGGTTIATCKKTKLQGECVQCCQEFETAGANKYAGALKSCICQADTCKEDCKGTFCATPQKNPDSTCGACAEGAQEGCGPIVLEACEADAKCKIFNGCLEDAKCPTKPVE